jgi:hypothetical protein
LCAQNQSKWLVDRMNSDPFMTSHTREVDDVEMVLLSLLDHTGRLSVPARVDGFFALMCRVQKVRALVYFLWCCLRQSKSSDSLHYHGCSSSLTTWCC